MIGFDKYKGKSGEYQMPYSQNPADKKDAKYFLAVAQYIAAEFKNDNTARNYADSCCGGHADTGNNIGSEVGHISGVSEKRNVRRTYKELRAYAENRQDVGKYKKQLTPKKQYKQGLTSIRISWDPPPILDKYISVIVNKFLKVDLKVNARSVNPLAESKKEHEKNFLALKYRKETQEFFKALGVEPPKSQSEKNGVKFNSEEDVELFSKLGGFRLATEIAVQHLAGTSIAESNFENIKKLLIKDYVTLNEHAVGNYVTQEGRVKLRYVNPEYLIYQDSEYPDHRDTEYIAEMRSMKYSMILDECGRELSNDDLRDLHKLQAETGTENTNGVKRSYEHLVMDVYFRSEDIYKATEKYIRTKDGVCHMCFNHVDHKYKLSSKEERKGKKLHTIKKQNIYKFKWVVGTNIIISYGEHTNQAKVNREGYREGVFPIQVFKEKGPSIVSRILPFVDDFCLATFKQRHLMSKMPPAPRIAIDRNYLETNEDKHPADVMDDFMANGYMLFRSMDTNFMPGSNKPTPFIPVPISIAQDYGLLVEQQERIIRQIELVVGVNDMTDGSTPNPKILKTVAQMAEASSSNALYDVFHAYRSLFLQSVKATVATWQEVIRDRPYRSKFLPFGALTAFVIEIGAELDLDDMGIYLEESYSQEEKDILYAELLQMKQKRDATGKGGLDEATYLSVRDIIKRGDPKHAAYVLSILTERQQKKDRKEEIENIQFNSQEQQKSAAAAVQGRIQEAQTMAKIEIEKEAQLLEMKKPYEEEEHRRELEKIKLQSDLRPERISA